MAITSAHRKVLASGWIGTTLEYYDFYVYATAASLVFNQVFFPEQTPFVGLALALATYGVGYLVRPFSGLILGHFGDSRGRKNVLVLTLVGMGVVTVLIGLLPGHDVLGPAAVGVLVALRLIQGIFVGGEWGGAITLVLENAPANRKTFFAAFTQMGSPSGLLLANLAFFLLAGLSNEAFLSIGWRIPFLLGGVLIIVGLVIRLKLDETPEFKKAANTAADKTQNAPIVELFKNHKRSVLYGFMLAVAPFGPFWLMNVFLVGFLTNTEAFNRGLIILIPIIVAATQLVLVIPMALLIDRLDARKVTVIGAIAAAVLTYPVFMFAQSDVPYGILIIFVMLTAAATNVMNVAIGSLVPLQFPVRARYTGSALVWNLAGAIGGGVVPIFAALSVQWLGGSVIGAAIIGSVVAILGAIGVMLMRNVVNTKPGAVAEPAAAREVSDVASH